MKINYAVLADAANETRDGKVNVLGVFTAINTSRVPSSLPCSLVVLMQPEPDDIDTDVNVVVQWVNPDHKVIIEHIVTISVKQPPFFPMPTANFIIPHQGTNPLPILQYGAHEMVLKCQQKEVRTPIDVRPSAPPVAKP